MPEVQARVLVFIPVHPPSLRHLRRNLQYWLAERGQAADVLVVANCDWVPDELEKLRQLAREFPFASVREELVSKAHPGFSGNLLAATSMAWESALSRGYTHLLHQDVVSAGV